MDKIILIFKFNKTKRLRCHNFAIFNNIFNIKMTVNKDLLKIWSIKLNFIEKIIEFELQCFNYMFY
jgi:hypothetical protein